MEQLIISWHGLVEHGSTCPRCGDTGKEVRIAARTLTPALAPLGITVVLEQGALSMEEFERTPLESNRILVQGRPLEEWVGAETGQSPCCDVCGPNDCRTVSVDGTSYETVPADLVVRAGLIAAASMISGAPAGTGAVLRP